MSKIDELQMTAKVEGDDLVIRLPLDLLIFSQAKREDTLHVVDKNAMAQYLEKRILDFGGDAEIGSTAFEDLLDSCFMEAIENAETWLMGWWEIDENDSDDEAQQSVHGDAGWRCPKCKVINNSDFDVCPVVWCKTPRP